MFIIRRDDAARVSINDETLRAMHRSTGIRLSVLLLIRFIENCMSSSWEDVRRVLLIDAIGGRTALRL